MIAAAAVCTACPPDPGPGPAPDGIQVTTTADVVDANDGVTSLREAFAIASSDGEDSTIVTTGGATYDLTNCAAGALVHDEMALTVLGHGGAATVRQTCSARVMVLRGGNSTLERLVIRGGRLGSTVNCTWPFNPPCNAGAGVEALTPITLRSVTFTDNLANLGPGLSRGGGLSALEGATIIDSRFESNVSDRSGGAVSVHGPLVVRNSTFMFNRGLEGNAIAIESGTATIEDSRFAANTGGSGGAIVMRGSSLVIRRSVLTDNNSGGGPGAAIWIDNGAAEVVLDHTAVTRNTGRAGALTSFGAVADYRILDSTITDNVATMNIRDQYNASAGGLAISGASDLTIVGSTIAHNSSPAGGGSNFDLTPSNGTTISIVDSVVSDPLGGGTNCALRSNVWSATSTFESDASCGGTVSPGSALLGPLTDILGTPRRTPQAGSALRDAHPGPCASSTDMLGTARPAGSGCDLGAIEQ